MFEIGKHCQCIRDNWGVEAFASPRLPMKGEIFTINAIDDVCGTLYLELTEIPPSHGYRYVWTATSFRPLDPKRIEIFTKMLAPRPSSLVDA